MAELNLKKNGIEEEDFSVIPDCSTSKKSIDGPTKTYVKKENEDIHNRKMFQNKKANIALIIVGMIIAATIIGAEIFIHMP